MKIKSLHIILLLSLCITATANSQDTLFFQRKDKPSKEYNIPFNQFLVVVKLKNGETNKALVSGIVDSSIVFKVWEDNWFKSVWKRRKLYKIYANKKNDLETKDSLAALMKYSYLDTVSVNDIKSFYIHSGERQDMRWFIVSSQSIAWASVLSSCTAILIQSPLLYSSSFILLMLDEIFILSYSYKTIKMKKWQIRRN